jgi:hypothetical protein
MIHWGECEVVRLFSNNRLFNQELPFEMGDYHHTGNDAKQRSPG